MNAIKLWRGICYIVGNSTLPSLALRVSEFLGLQGEVMLCNISASLAVLGILQKQFSYIYTVPCCCIHSGIIVA